MWTKAILISDQIKQSHGNLTDEHIMRCGQVAAMKDRIDSVMSIDVLGEDPQKSKKSPAKEWSDIRSFVKIYSRDNLFDCVPERAYKTFPSFEMPSIKQPEKLRASLRKYSFTMDRDHECQQITGLNS